MFFERVNLLDTFDGQPADYPSSVSRKGLNFYRCKTKNLIIKKWKGGTTIPQIGFGDSFITTKKTNEFSLPNASLF